MLKRSTDEQEGNVKLGVFGSRSIRDERVKLILQEEIDNTGADTIVTTQEPKGVCTVAQQFAKENNLVLELHFLNFKYKTGAYEHRSDEVIKASDRILLIHDGESHGTRNELERVKKFGKPYRYEVIEKTDTEMDEPVDERLSSFTDHDKPRSNGDVGFFVGGSLFGETDELEDT